MATTRFHMVSLGCAKNTVDSESMSTLLGRSGFQVSERPEEAEVLIVNTCGFIGPAKEESLAVLRELAQGKREGQLLIAAGCLTQRYGSTVVEQVPGIDGVLGTRRWMDIVQVVQSLRERRHPEPLYHLPEAPAAGKEEQGVDRVAVSGASAYLKIADGCRRTCAFCAIPLIKGPTVSRPAEEILGDARRLQEAGVREVILIAQDSTDYGHDLGVKDGLAKLLEDLVAAIPDVDWIRVMYAYPGYVTDRLIEVMAENEQILPYLDMPLQHADPNVLRDMRRPANVDWVQRTIEKMRGAMPDLALRTTFIVGYPGETEKAFGKLMDFIQEIRFDRVGVFSYSPESGTAGEPLGDPIPMVVKEERRDRLMTLQQRISLERNQAFLGDSLPVLIEGCGDGISLGRSYRDAPEIDGMVIVEEEIRAGEMVQVRITGALEYDLSGVIADGAAAPP
ncbi:MAG: 30S ribosomal protein S12 methylthiotransferase RimO [Anaerolineales bacterium]